MKIRPEEEGEMDMVWYGCLQSRPCTLSLGLWKILQFWFNVSQFDITFIELIAWDI